MKVGTGGKGGGQGQGQSEGEMRAATRRERGEEEKRGEGLGCGDGRGRTCEQVTTNTSNIVPILIIKLFTFVISVVLRFIQDFVIILIVFLTDLIIKL